MKPSILDPRSYSAAPHALPAVVTQIAIPVTNGNRSAVVTRRGIRLELGKLLAPQLRTFTGRGLVMAVAVRMYSIQGLRQRRTNPRRRRQHRQRRRSRRPGC